MSLSCIPLPFISALLYLCTDVSAQKYNDTEFAPASFWTAHADNPAIRITANSSRFSGRAKSVSQCLCSPSARGHPPLSDPDVSNFTELLTEFATVSVDSLRIPTFNLKLNRLSASFIQRYGAEGYINLDAKLRSILPMTHCFYDVPSGRNVRVFERIPSNDFTLISMRGCDMNDSTAAPAAARARFIPSRGPSPPSQVDATDLPSAPIEQQSFAPSPSTETPVPGPSSSTSAGRRETPVPSPTSVPQTRINEGCFAVEHLGGHVMQYRSHLRRKVMCSRGFCATPNHAIIVDGLWTSMKRLCAEEWTCTKDVRLVNNLKISALTRLRVDERIIITPYDIRFPISFSWVVQIAEDVWEILLLSLKIAAFFLILLATYFFVKADIFRQKVCGNAIDAGWRRIVSCEDEIKRWMNVVAQYQSSCTAMG